MKIYRKEGQCAERPHLNLPPETYEEELGLEGFFGLVSHLYHRHPPTSWSGIRKAGFQWPQIENADREFLKPECYDPIHDESSSGNFFESGRLMFHNDDVSIWTHQITEAESVYFRNADASEVYFCHQGSGRFESIFGSFEIRPGDYLVVPKGVTYRWQSEDLYILRVESFHSPFRKPETGILGQQALYHEEGIETPKFHQPAKDEISSRIWTQSERVLTEIQYDFDIRSISGWMGTLYPYKLSVKNIAPVMSSIAHLPPSINSTFLANGFVICTFLPRPLEEPHGALKVPFYHSNIDYDEVIFYHEGNFFSRDNMKKGCMTLHPRGIHHGPHPKALSMQHQMKRTDEIAVMIDTEKPLKVSRFARTLEQRDYWKSWMPKS